ncbi:TIGR03364 family FAD-dependent oxidoreductase [soil metagenome]
MNVVIVGGGILGTMHAVEARRRGWRVVQLDVDAEPQSSSVRGLGVIDVSSAAPGLALDLALRAREGWESLARRAPGVGFRATGSITLAADDAQRRVIAQVLQRDDAERRGLRGVTAKEVGAINPSIRGVNQGGVFCRTDAIIEPRRTLEALRRYLQADAGYRFLGGRTAWEVGTGVVHDTTGRSHRGDLVLVCPGARQASLSSELLHGAPLRQVRSLVAQTGPYGERLSTIVDDGETMRRRPGFDVPARASLPEPIPVATEFHAHLSCAPRVSGALTFGTTHEYEQPFTFDLSDRAVDHLADRLQHHLSGSPGRIVRRWESVYHECTDDRLWFRDMVSDDVLVVTGAGASSLTLAPAVAEDTFDWLAGGIDSQASAPSIDRVAN